LVVSPILLYIIHLRFVWIFGMALLMRRWL
jgi:hypothetical protein